MLELALWKLIMRENRVRDGGGGEGTQFNFPLVVTVTLY